MTTTMFDITWMVFALPSIILASAVHEYAHAATAYKLGDPTAKAEGRMTLNPLAHIDPMGILCMVLFRFGWSKPVPINENNFTNKKLGMALSALSGPVSNFILLLLTALLNYLLKPSISSPIYLFLFVFAIVNCSLSIFNLIPIPPLDGHKIVGGLLPNRLSYYWDDLEKYSLLLIIVLVLPIFPFGSLASYIISSAIGNIMVLLGFY
ncbi:MAG TPA: site-2 protease family protein [Candidatus Dojkabacteria bacterium]|nr:site-2 protease family protein [Candidatus Dojkabacteria bacterium]